MSLVGCAQVHLIHVEQKRQLGQQRKVLADMDLRVRYIKTGIDTFPKGKSGWGQGRVESGPGVLGHWVCIRQHTRGPNLEGLT